MALSIGSGRGCAGWLEVLPDLEERRTVALKPTRGQLKAETIEQPSRPSGRASRRRVALLTFRLRNSSAILLDGRWRSSIRIGSSALMRASASRLFACTCSRLPSRCPLAFPTA